jgi:exonuclease III
MKVVTWNCNGAFRKKYEALDELNADILVIQECENPSQCSDAKYKSWANNYLWIGDNKNKGLGIFVKRHFHMTTNKWENNGTKHFISVRINNSFDLVAVWNHHANSPNFGYIGQFWKYMQINKNKMSESIILGDFNSNKRWDEWDRWWNHSDVVRELEEIGIRSLYHEHYNDPQGEEIHPTFYLQRNLSKAYHIDYLFASKIKFPTITNLEIGEASEWLKISDHMPVIVVLEDNICDLYNFI